MDKFYIKYGNIIPVLNVSNENIHAVGKKYNVEYELGNGKMMTFSNTLEYINSKYFIFKSEEYGLDLIRRDRIVTMTCIREKQ